MLNFSYTSSHSPSAFSSEAVLHLKRSWREVWVVWPPEDWQAPEQTKMNCLAVPVQKALSGWGLQDETQKVG